MFPEDDIVVERINRRMKEAGLDMEAMAFRVTNDPPVVTLCGSTRYWKEFQEASLCFTLMDTIVLSVGAATASDTDHIASGDLLPHEKENLDMLHLAKIYMSNFIFVLNVDGYIGHSTAREIIFAYALGLPVFFHDKVKAPTMAYVYSKAEDREDVEPTYEPDSRRYPFDGFREKRFGWVDDRAPETCRYCSEPLEEHSHIDALKCVAGLMAEEREKAQ